MVSKKNPKIAQATAKAPLKDRCAICGHWSPATESGLDDNAGYCDQLEKITDRNFWCDEFVTKDQYQRLQDDLVSENEEYMDDD